MKKRSNILVMAMVLGLFLLTSSVSLAATLDGVKFNDGATKVIDTEDLKKAYISNSNIVDITIDFSYEDGDEVTSIKVGTLIENFDEYDTSKNYTLKDYELKKGVNSVPVEITSKTGKPIKETIKIDYAGSISVIGSKYQGEIPTDGKLNVLENAVNLTFAKGNYVIDADSKAADNNSITLTVIPQDLTGMSLYNQPINNWVEIKTVVDDTYKLAFPGTITLEYNKSEVDLSSNLITILYKSNASSATWENIGAVVDSKKNMATASFKGFGTYGVFIRSTHFADSNWSRPFVETLWSKGIMKTRNATGTAVPDSSDAVYLITESPTEVLECSRGEFATMIVKGLGLNRVSTNTGRFTDIIGADGDELDILTAAAYGIMQGKGNGTFAPEESLTRQEAAVVVARVSNLTLVTDNDKAKNDLGKIFKDTTDLNNIAEWAMPHVLACVKAKMIQGEPDGTIFKFNATNTLKMDQSAKLVYNIMQAKKRF